MSNAYDHDATLEGGVAIQGAGLLCNSPCAKEASRAAIEWKAYEAVRWRTYNQLIDWFANEDIRNIGIVTGAVSQIVVLDVDHREGAGEIHPELPQDAYR